MGQEAIVNFLEKNKGKKFTCKELIDNLEYSPVAVRRSLNRLLEFKEIKYREITSRKQKAIHNVKRRFKVYFL